MTDLLLIPLDDTVVFPTMDVTLPVDVGGEERVLLVPRHDGEYASVGTIAERRRARPPARRRPRRGARGRRRAASPAPPTPTPTAACASRSSEHADDVPVDGRTRELEREYRAVVEEILELRGDDGRVAPFLRSIAEPGALADTSGYSPDLTFEQKVELLETLDVTERLRARPRAASASGWPSCRSAARSATTSSPAPQKQQREYFLRKQMESIRRELGEDDGSVVDEYRTKIDEAGMPDDVREQAERELGRLERIGRAAAARRQMIRTYLDWLIAVPWGERSEERLDPVARARGARRRPRRPGGRQGPHRRVHRRAQAARGARHRGRPQGRARS